MEFESFLQLISNIKDAELGGLESQFKMAPAIRRQFASLDFEQYNPKKAGVLALFYPDIQKQTRFLLTLRAQYKGVHSAQVSFPGGKFENQDQSLKHTAKRETEEEVGIPANRIDIVKTMSNTYIPPSNFLVQPYMGTYQDIPKFQYNNEVNEIISVKLSDLLDHGTVSSKKMNTSYMDNIDVPCFMLNGYVVWGATAMMLSEIKDLLLSL